MTWFATQCIDPERKFINQPFDKIIQEFEIEFVPTPNIFTLT